ncbi:MAG: SMP-30/gluconolactonase/LRE family protein [Rhodospirillaceae bacterium]|jgi:sugar lactone lactonase YvrE|nr:SMP-30/gluconolactonase/LRE family protein [Rhodospirillaceae bacterium]MBT5195710.1 SMP-30/gluconolactonase/LRE family protein [Rhodospirillaceae bacterium]MBT5456674.1 SMP-30/gluconolactonase/LRE family protein [Rhodospirillaceae bacterium]MBT7759595.1 SMP-30/gluconolactonase/LRE family protein [Rhodospirillaceae bacterium]
MSDHGYHPDLERVVCTKDRLGETPLWCGRTKKIWWIDIEEPKLQSFDPVSGAHLVYPMDCTYLGSLALTKTDQLLVAMDLTLSLFNPDTGDITPLAKVDDGLDNRLNDGRVDRKGRFWVGTMDNQLRQPNGSLYRLGQDGSIANLLDGIIVTNGIAHSPDNRTLYFTDTRRFTTWAFDLDPDDGTISNRRIFADYTATGDRPDGACIDVDGCLWTAFFAGSRIVRYRPDGGIDQTIPLPVSNPTCVCFGGEDLKTLYITTASKFLTAEQRAAEPWAGSLLAIQGIGQGVAEHRFG